MTRCKPKEKSDEQHLRLEPSGRFVVWNGGRPGPAKGLHYSGDELAARGASMANALGIGGRTAVCVFSTLESIAQAHPTPERLAIAGLIDAETYLRITS